MGDPKAFSEDLVAMRDQVATELDGILAAVKDQRQPTAKLVAKRTPPTDATIDPDRDRTSAVSTQTITARR